MTSVLKTAGEMADLLEELFKKRTDDGKKPLQVPGLSFIHPMHEAAIAFFRKNVTSGQICQMFAKDENSLRQAISLEVLADQLDPQKRQQVIARLPADASLSQIVEVMALSYAEGKRMQNGSVLKEIVIPTDSEGKYLLEAIRQEKITPLYLESAKVGNLASRAKEIRARRITGNVIKYVAITALTAFAGLFFYAGARIIGEDEARLASQERELAAYMGVLNQMPYTEKTSFINKYEEELKASKK